MLVSPPPNEHIDAPMTFPCRHCRGRRAAHWATIEGKRERERGEEERKRGREEERKRGRDREERRENREEGLNRVDGSTHGIEASQDHDDKEKTKERREEI